MSPTVLGGSTYSRIRTLHRMEEAKTNEGKSGRRMGRFIDTLLDRYVNLIYRFPLLVIFVTGFAAFFMTFFGIYFHSDAFTFNPRDGFETRGTPLANERMALMNLMDRFAKIDDLKLLERPKREARIFTTTEAPFTINYDDYGSDDFQPDLKKIDACMQYAMLGTPQVPYDYTMVLSKIIWRIDSLEDLFSLSVMQDLCHLDTLIAQTVNSTNATSVGTQLPFSFNAPYYSMCANLTSTKRCEDLTQEKIDEFRKSVFNCTSATVNRSGLCGSSIFVQLRNMVFPKQFDSRAIGDSDPIHIAATMPILINFDGKSMHFYRTLHDNIVNFYRNSRHIEVKGLYMNAKEAFFETALLKDSIFAGISMASVILGILIYSQSFVFTLVVTFGLILSVGSAYFLYTVVFGITFFPFINLLVFVLIVAIGADDAFLLNYCYVKRKTELVCLFKKNDRSEESLSQSSSQPDTVDKERCRESLKEALRHAAIAMFVTSATTAVAFFANAASDILVLRCFGVFAGATMLVNYVFVVTALPACVVFVDTTVKCPNGKRRLLGAVSKRLTNWTTHFFGDIVPLIVSKTYPLVIVVFLLIATGSTFVVVKSPGIRLPENNPMQILRSSHPFEWFDESANAYFNFKAGQERRFNFYVLFGLLPTDDSSSFILSKRGTLKKDPKFDLSRTESLFALEEMVKSISRSSAADWAKANSTTLWISHFLKFAKGTDCGECCVNEKVGCLSFAQIWKK
ncbi:hypothetical protein QR680_005881 [Steinernema hermaphroditum]|uniref:SSD domain-containing protein n=1 Tax=Steinernema hermaphroditum TaxID=289476 RepID=A0AA39HUQ9_9BILA|nr:hypothetical protein QR680_005881 [Steinernema hermaphroditum]